MTQLHQYVRTGCCVAVAVAVCLFLHSVDAKLLSLSGVQSTITSVQRIVNDADVGVKQINDIAKNIGDAVTMQRNEQARQTREFNKALADSHDLFSHLDTTLNKDNGLIPTATKTLSLFGDTISATTRGVNAITARVTDTRIDDIETHLDMASLHFEGVAASSDLAFAHGNHIISYYDERLTSPKGFTKTFFTGVKDWIVMPGASIATAWRTH